MNYAEWEAQISSELSGQLIWKIQLYRMALFVAELARRDAQQLAKDPLMEKIGESLVETASDLPCQISIAHTSEEHSEAVVAAYQQALRSARQSKDWYYKSRPALGATVTAHRLKLLQQLVLLLLSQLPVSESTQHIRSSTSFSVIPHHLLTDIPLV